MNEKTNDNDTSTPPPALMRASEEFDSPRANEMTRRDFGGTTMAHENAATQALIAKQTADSQSRWIMAMRAPRSIVRVHQSILRECERVGFAETAIYKLPRGGKEITGLTIRFAEVAMRCMGNMSCEAQTLYDSDEERVVRVITTDYESNSTWWRDITIKKTVERRELRRGQRAIRQRTNSTGDVVYLVEATEDDMRMREGAEISRAARTAILRLIPGHIQDEAFDRCMSIIAGAAAKDPDGERRKMIGSFEDLGVLVPDLERMLGHSVERVTPAETAEMKLIYVAIRSGELTIPEAIEQAEGGRSARAAGAKPANGNSNAATAPTTAPNPTPSQPSGKTGGKGAAAAKEKIKTAAAPKTEEKQVGPQGPEMDVEAKRAAARTPEPKVAPEPVKDGYEKRNCEMCGDEISVPVGDPDGAICLSCANQE